MFWKRLTIVSILSTCVAGSAFSAECGNHPAKEMNLYPGAAASSLQSPDQRWKLVSVRANPSEQWATLFIQNAGGSKKRSIGRIERRGTAFWSDDSKRLFLRDEYAADDTKIRVFDVADTAPREIKGVDRELRRAILTHIPQNETSLWLYYPKVCFADNDSSMIIVVADAPLVPKRGTGSGKPFGLRLTLNLKTLKIVDSIPAENPPEATAERSPNAVAAPSDWHKVDAGPFSISAPSGWQFHQLVGVDSFVGEFMGDGVTLTFDYGGYSNPLKEEKKPAYVVIHKSIGGFLAKIVSPRTPGHGITGVYFRDVGRSNGLCLFAKDLTSTQQDLALKIFETVRFGGSPPRYLFPLPQPAAAESVPVTQARTNRTDEYTQLQSFPLDESGVHVFHFRPTESGEMTLLFEVDKAKGEQDRPVLNRLQTNFEVTLANHSGRTVCQAAGSPEEGVSDFHWILRTSHDEAAFWHRSCAAVRLKRSESYTLTVNIRDVDPATPREMTATPTFERNDNYGP